MGDSAHTTHHPSRRMTHCPQKCISKKLRNTKKTRRKSIGFLKTRLGNFLPYEFVGTMGHHSFINKRTVPILYVQLCVHTATARSCNPVSILYLWVVPKEIYLNLCSCHLNIPTIIQNFTKILKIILKSFIQYQNGKKFRSNFRENGHTIFSNCMGKMA
jgi:hypothetical protein